MFPKEMYAAKRCFKECGGVIKEVVSVGYFCKPIRCVYTVFPDTPEVVCIPKSGFGNYEVGVTHLFDVCEDIDSVISAAKESLNKDEQILYSELYTGKELDGASGFEFCGYDLLEAGASAIYDCSFELEFDFNIVNINDFGLISTIEEAIEIDKKLRMEFPDERHAHCEICGVWRYVN
jgi:hypothetical protein